jgi:ribosome recycling factor
MIQAVANTLKDSELGVNPQIEGSQISIPVPPMTKEIRENAVKLAKKVGEKTKEMVLFQFY